MSRSLGTNSGSHDTSTASPDAAGTDGRQMRCTEERLIPAALAMAPPVQWVVSPGGSVCVSATTRSATTGGSGATATGASLAQHPLDTFVHEARLPAPQTGLALAGAPHDLVGAEALGSQQHDPRSLHVLLRAVPGRHDPLKPDTSGGAHVDGDPCAHPSDSHLCEPSEIPAGLSLQILSNSRLLKKSVASAIEA